MKTKLGLLAATLVAAMVLPMAAFAGECLTDSNGYAISGSICCHAAIPLAYASINESRWSSTNAYDAVRTDANNVVTYDQSYPSGGDNSYGTAGNTSRKTWFDLDISGTSTNWAESESSIC